MKHLKYVPSWAQESALHKSRLKSTTTLECLLGVRYDKDIRRSRRRLNKDAKEWYYAQRDCIEPIAVAYYCGGYG